MKELVEHFLAQRWGRLRPSSWQREAGHLHRFEEFCRKLGLKRPQELQRDHLRAYYRELLTRSAKNREAPSFHFLYMYLSSLRRFLDWCNREHHLFIPWEVPVPKPIKKLPRVPSPEEVQRLLKIPDPKTRVGARDRYALELLYSWGLRVGECVRLNLESFDETHQRVKVTGKGDRSRWVPLSPRLTQLHQRYLTEVRPRFQAHSGTTALFLTTRGRIQNISLYVRVKVYARAGGLNLHPHQLRHACATHMLEQGARLRQVQELLGHAQVMTTQGYTRISIRELKQEFRRCHPRAHFPKEEGSREPSESLS